MMMMMFITNLVDGANAKNDDDDVYYSVYYKRWRLKLGGETESRGVCTKERKGITAEVLMATPCTRLMSVCVRV